MVSNSYFSIYSNSIKFSFQKHAFEDLKRISLKDNVTQITVQAIMEGSKFGKHDHSIPEQARS